LSTRLIVLLHLSLPFYDRTISDVLERSLGHLMKAIEDS
jgi:hypothetical protein